MDDGETGTSLTSSKAPALRKLWPKLPRRRRPQLPCLRCRRNVALRRFEGGRAWVLDQTVAGCSIDFQPRSTSAELWLNLRSRSLYVLQQILFHGGLCRF